MKIISQRILKTKPMETFNRLFYSDVFRNALVNKIRRHSAARQYPDEPIIQMIYSKIKDLVG